MLLFIGVLQRLAVLRCCELLVSWKIQHQLSTFFPFSLFFCKRFHADGMHLSHAQMHSIVVLLLY